MNLDDIALGILKEHLVPFFGKGRSIVGIGDAVVVQQFLESRNIIGSEGNMPAFNRIDGLTVFECHTKIYLGQMHLHMTICGKTDLAALAAVFGLIRSGEVLDRDVVQPEDVRVEMMQALHVLRDIVDVVEFQFHDLCVS